jgi:hypothetical protein
VCWAGSVYPNACRSASTSMEWVELTPDQVAKRIVHVVMAAVFVGVTLLGVALQL